MPEPMSRTLDEHPMEPSIRELGLQSFHRAFGDPLAYPPHGKVHQITFSKSLHQRKTRVFEGANFMVLINHQTDFLTPSIKTIGRQIDQCFTLGGRQIINRVIAPDSDIVVCRCNGDFLFVLCSADMEILRQVNHAIAVVFIPFQIGTYGYSPWLQNGFQ